MSVLDKLRSKVGEMTGRHGDKAGPGIDKTGDMIDTRTGRKHSGRIRTGADRAKDAVGHLGRSSRHGSDPGSDSVRDRGM